ncbi:MAG: sulfotransferase family 2 domain-containing protein [Leptospirales bacterium]
MLISHRKKFIYTKTVKTAGTSVESYFEKYCMPEGQWKPSHSRAVYETESGVIGKRGPDQTAKWIKKFKAKPKWKSHMPAVKIKNLVDEKLWNSYFKFCVIRNPYDKMVSMFYMKLQEEKEYSQYKKFKIGLKKKFNIGDPFDLSTGDDDTERFKDWVKKGGKIIDRNMYIIQDDVCVDFFIRYEELESGIKEVCKKIAVPFEPDRIPRFKSGRRKTNTELADFYDEQAKDIITKKYQFEIDTFGYALNVQ